MADPDSRETLFDPWEIVKLQYGSIKDEQIKRIAFRDNLPYVTIAVTATALVATTKLGMLILLVVPLACTLLGWGCLMNDLKVTQMARCIRERIIPFIEEHAEPGVPVLPWESYYRTEELGRRSRLACQLAIDMATFCGSAVLALLIYWVRGDRHPVWLAVSIVETALPLMLAYRMVKLAEVGRPGTVDTDA